MDDVMDIDGDGVPDAVLSSYDLDGDGNADIHEVGIDTTGDGIFDTTLTSIDLDGDGFDDIGAVEVDHDGDGVPDETALGLIDEDGNIDMFGSVDAADSIWGDTGAGFTDSPFGYGEVDLNAVAGDPYETINDTFHDVSLGEFEDYYQAHGTPLEDMALWDPQDEPMSCAVAVTNSMLRSMGIDPGEPAIAEIFSDQGIYDEAAGTNYKLIDDAINIASFHAGLDIQATDFSGASVDQLTTMLDAGVRPLIAVDSALLNAGAEGKLLSDLGLLPESPHAVHLTGIEHTGDGSIAIINDPYFGPGIRVPLEEFQEAAGSQFSGVAMSNAETMASLSPSSLGQGLESEGVALGMPSEPVRADVFGNVFKGNSIIPLRDPLTNQLIRMK